MKNIVSIVAGILSFLVVYNLMTKKSDDEFKKEVKSEIGYGDVSKGKYTNDYFGLTVKFPENWYVQDNAAKKQMQKAAEEFVGENDKYKKMVELSDIRSLNLLTVMKHPLGKPVNFNPNFICMAEKVSDVPQVKSGKDYIEATKQNLKMAGIKIEFGKEYVTTVGGVKFDTVDLLMKQGPFPVDQTYYAAKIKDYALCFILSFDSKEAKAELDKILAGVNFK